MHAVRATRLFFPYSANQIIVFWRRRGRLPISLLKPPVCWVAEDGTDLFISACRTCSTTIFSHSTNQVLNLWRWLSVSLVDAKAPSCGKVVFTRTRFLRLILTHQDTSTGTPGSIALLRNLREVMKLMTNILLLVFEVLRWSPWPLQGSLSTKLYRTTQAGKTRGPLFIILSFGKYWPCRTKCVKLYLNYEIGKSWCWSH